MNGAPLGIEFPGYDVRRGTLSDLAACSALCQRVHGQDRSGELQNAISQGTARVVEHLGAITPMRRTSRLLLTPWPTPIRVWRR